jgi:hypothetical protein
VAAGVLGVSVGVGVPAPGVGDLVAEPDGVGRVGVGDADDAGVAAGVRLGFGVADGAGELVGCRTSCCVLVVDGDVWTADWGRTE